MITRSELLESLSYDRETGIFTRKTRVGGHGEGSKAGSISQLGYVYIRVRGHSLQAHRLAWLYEYGMWPKEIDHIDGCPSNNSIANLREATRQQNTANRGKPKQNTSGFKGVTWCKQTATWKAQIGHLGKVYHLGRFKRPEEAYAVYSAECRRLNGPFANTGSVEGRTADVDG